MTLATTVVIYYSLIASFVYDDQSANRAPMHGVGKRNDFHSDNNTVSGMSRELPGDTIFFSETLTLDAASAIASDMSVNEGQRNEALNALREQNRLTAISLLIRIIENTMETEKFRSWAVQHLGLLGEAGDPGELTNIIPALISGLNQHVDSPIWRESLFALTGISHPRAFESATEELRRLTPPEIKAIGPLHADLVRRLQDSKRFDVL